MSYESYYAKIAEDVERVGHSITMVGDRPAFAYTIGRSLVSPRQELLIVAHISPQSMMAIVNHLAEEAGDRFLADGDLVALSDQYSAQARVLGPWARSERSIQAGQFLGHEDYSIVQMLIPDTEGRYDTGYALQEMLRQD